MPIKKNWSDYQAEELYEKLQAEEDPQKAIDMIASALWQVWSQSQPRDSIDM
jgi:hypothetical protein